jgi:alpha-ketoglutarate-dependent taurine dioxygenase
LRCREHGADQHQPVLQAGAGLSADRRGAQGPEQKTNIGGGWHTDHSYDQIPALGSILLAREVPPRGGDTMFACMAQAYADVVGRA